jgi:two-component system cell cycle sensor histidine kinase/response regulator CckA
MTNTLPPSEASRLAALRRYGILDTFAEQSFDDLTQLAAQICGTPIALITLVDEDRQWFKARTGITVSETPREHSFCTHAIQQRDIFVVRDALTDSRFANNPMVTGEPGIRFYAGVPLVAADEQAIGTVCVVDTVPRELTPNQVQALQALARQAMNQMELRLTLRALEQTHREHQQTEESLRQSEAEFRATFENAAMGVALVNPTGQLLKANRALQQMLGYSEPELRAMTFTKFTHPDDVAADLDFYKELIAGQRDQYQLEKRFLRKDGGIISTRLTVSVVRSAAGKPQYAIGMIEDITEKKRLELQFLRTQRLEGIGAVASGVAHDLNNILAPILMSVPMLRWGISPEESDKIHTTIETSARRGADLVKQLLTFGRGIEGKRSHLQAGHLLREMAIITGETFPKSIQIRSTCDPELWPVHGDPTQLHQVLLNLCVNARDAMPQGGKLTLTATNIVLDEQYATMLPEAKAGPYMMIRVADTGKGIAPELIERIFEPFFTTKEVGCGTGLGLSTVMGIVRSHGGFLTVDSQPGQGTEFAIYLPAAPGCETATNEAVQEQPPRGNGELILLVDDETAITDISRRTLEKYGYRVLIAHDGVDALTLYARQTAEIKAVVTDLEMPFLDGFGLVQAIKRIQPEAPILIATGRDSEDNNNEKLEQLREAGVARFLTKPFTSHTLLDSVHGLFHRV